jgi:hypothetical protein
MRVYVGFTSLGFKGLRKSTPAPQQNLQLTKQYPCLKKKSFLKQNVENITLPSDRCVVRNSDSPPAHQRPNLPVLLQRIRAGSQPTPARWTTSV